MRKLATLLAVAVVFGSVEVRIGDETFTLGAGDRRVFAEEAPPAKEKGDLTAKEWRLVAEFGDLYKAAKNGDNIAEDEIADWLKKLGITWKEGEELLKRAALEKAKRKKAAKVWSLELESHPGMAIVAGDDFKLQHGYGEILQAGNAIAEPIKVFFDGRSIRKVDDQNLAFEVARNEYKEGTIVLFWAGRGHPDSAQEWKVNADKTISPEKAAHLVLGPGENERLSLVKRGDQRRLVFAAPNQSAESVLMNRWLGTWLSKVTISPSLWMAEGSEQNEIKEVNWILNGSFQQSSSRSNNHEAREVQRYEARSKKYQKWTFDTNGGANYWLGDWDEKSQTMTWQIQGGGIKGTMTDRFLGADKSETYETKLVIKDGEGKTLLDILAQHTRILNK